MFPASKALQRKNPVDEAIFEPIKKDQALTFTNTDIIQKMLGHRILNKLNPICETAVEVNLSQVLAVTPEASVSLRKTKQQQKQKRRKLVKNVKESLEAHRANQDVQLVYGNSLSFKKYNEIRLAESFEEEPKAKNQRKPNPLKISPLRVKSF